MSRTIFHRKIIRIKATSSPNVRLALAQIAAGQEPTFEQVIPGILSAEEYFDRLELLKDDPKGRSIKLDAEFYKGEEVMLYPTDWLNNAERIARELSGLKRIAKGMGVDPAEGGDRTSIAVSDERGLIELTSKKTPDTSVIANDLWGLARRYDLEPNQIVIDRGGGGKQIADYLAKLGFPIRTVAFGEQPVPELKRGMTTFKERVDKRADIYTYKNRRAEMYWLLRMSLDVHNQYKGWGVPDASCGDQYKELRRQMSVIPLEYDNEGRIKIMPKRNTSENSKEMTLEKLLGCSPDELDATVMSIYAMTKRTFRSVVGGM